MKTFVFVVLFDLFFFLLFMPSCSEQSENITVGKNNIKNGDIVFVVDVSNHEQKQNTMDDAIVEATGSVGEDNATHVGIIEVKEDSIMVIDATPTRGVSIRSFDDFKSECFDPDENTELVVMRLKCSFSADSVISKAKSLIGKNYDFAYLPNNNEYYCSELVQVCFVDNEGKMFFESSPMNFKGKDGKFPEYWVSLFSRLNMSIPQGVDGTNPNDMMKSDSLEFVLKFVQ